jgi:hypothetical protein
MIDAFEEMCIWVYVTVDDLYRDIVGQTQRPGSDPVISDSELLTIILVSESKGWENESEWASHWSPYVSLFGGFPERSRLNRRRRALSVILNLIRFRLVQGVSELGDSRCLLDSLPIEVVTFKRVPQSQGNWWEHGASYGRWHSRQATFFGFKLYLLVTFTGFLVDFMLTNGSRAMICSPLTPTSSY